MLNDTIKFYISSSDKIENLSMLKKMIFLIIKHDLSFERYNTIIKVSEVSIEDFNKISCSLNALCHDLELTYLTLIVCPFYINNIEKYDIIKKTGVYYLYDILLRMYRDSTLDIPSVTSLFDNVPNEILETIRNYIRLNQSLSLTGELMFAHRNTINYRINKFISLTSINVREMKNAMFVYFVLALMEENRNLK